MKTTKSQLKQIIKEEISSILEENEQLRRISQLVQNMPDDPQLRKSFITKYAKKANRAMGKEKDDPWGTSWVNNIVLGGALEENLGEDMSPEAQQLYEQGKELFGRLIEMGKKDHPEVGDILDALDEWASETSFEYVRIKSLY
jgi:hypothetical protein